MFASGIAPSMQDTGHTVSCLCSEGNFSVEGVKGHAKIDQVGNAVRGFVDQDTHCIFVT
ncbi:hypothetical protein ES703_94168 [subsurface metagenome]